MPDTLNIFGIEYNNVTSLNAKIGSASNATELTYIRPVGVKTITENGNGIDVSNFASVNVNIPLNLQSKIINYTPTETQQTQTVTADSGYDGLSSVNITVDAISDSYIGSAVPIRNDNDLIASGAMVSVPVGYYSSLSSKSVTIGTEGTPIATKGTVSNHTISITPSVTNTAGYINGGSHTGTAVSVTASELVSGTLNIIENGIVDVTNYANINVDVAGSSPANLQAKTNISPTESSQTITADSGYDGLSSVQINAISSTYVGSGITQRSSSDLTASGATVTVPSGYYASQQTKSVASGTAGTPIATKGSVTNHSISVTPSVTNTGGYINGGTINGTSVSVSASELVSGSQTVTENGTIDVTNLAQIIVEVEGSTTPGMMVATATATPASASASIQFTGLSGDPTSFVVISNSDLATGASPFKTAAVVFDGTDLHGQTITNTNNAQVTYANTGFSKTYANGTLTITGTTYWQPNAYTLIYTYGGNASNIGTADVQVGSGATSITFTGLSDEPDYFSLIFKSNFATSSGYQRVIALTYDGDNIHGLAMDSGAKALTSWTYTYNNGSLTITSTGTNNGGYFHQPGYYQLTYGVGGEASPYQQKTVNPSATQQVVTADEGYDALSQVTVEAVVTNNISAANIKAGTTVTVGDSGNASRIASVTGTFTSDADATASDIVNGKSGYVNGNKVNGTLVIQHYYTGSTAPSSSLGSNGDIYLQT